MPAFPRAAVGLLGLLLLTPALGAYPPWCNPLTKQPYPPAPDACGPGFFVVGPYGMVYGPNYYLVPPWAPVGTCVPTNHCAQQAAQPMPVVNPMTGKMEFPNPGPKNREIYPTHPFVRSPRDFFMWNESLEEQEGRSPRPGFVP